MKLNKEDLKKINRGLTEEEFWAMFSRKRLEFENGFPLCPECKNVAGCRDHPGGLGGVGRMLWCQNCNLEYSFGYTGKRWEVLMPGLPPAASQIGPPDSPEEIREWFSLNSI